MAFKLAIPSDRFGTAFPNAHVEVSEIRIRGTSAEVSVAVYADQAASTARARPLERRQVRFSLKGDLVAEVVARVDAALMALPEFSGVTAYES